MSAIVARMVEVCVFKMVKDRPEYLLLRRAADEEVYPGLWQIVTGTIEEGETALHAALREMKEETGLAITDIRFVLVQDCIHSKEFYRDAHFVLLNYTCRCAGKPRVKLNDEARESRWVTPGVAMKMPLNAPTRKLLEAVSGRDGSQGAGPRRKR